MFLMIPLIFQRFININEYTNYANKIICLFDHGKKAWCLCINLVPILVDYDK